MGMNMKAGPILLSTTYWFSGHILDIQKPFLNVVCT
jgi:hypothetical protein